MRCSEIMKSEVEYVSPRTSLRDAARKMRDEKIGFLPVCDEASRPLGTITDRDIAVRAVAEDLAPGASVKECLTPEVVDCSPADDTEVARELMEKHHVSRVMCTNDDGRIAGIISLSDIADLNENSGARTLRRVSQRELRGRTPAVQESSHRP